MIPEGWGPAWQQATDRTAGVRSWEVRAHISKCKQKAERVNWEWSTALKSQSPCSVTYFLQQGYTSSIHPNGTTTWGFECEHRGAIPIQTST